MRELWIFLAVCALLASVTLGARAVRVEAERAQHYARVVAACANGVDFMVGNAIVHCIRVEVRR